MGVEQKHEEKVVPVTQEQLERIGAVEVVAPIAERPGMFAKASKEPVRPEAKPHSAGVKQTHVETHLSNTKEYIKTVAAGAKVTTGITALLMSGWIYTSQILGWGSIAFTHNLAALVLAFGVFSGLAWGVAVLAALHFVILKLTHPRRKK